MARIRTGSDGNHVTVYELAGQKIAVVDERATRRDKRAAGLDDAKWIGCWGSGPTAEVVLPFVVDRVIGATDSNTHPSQCDPA